MEDNKLQLMATCLHQMGLDVDPASVNLTSEEEFVVVKYRRRDLENGGISSVAKSNDTSRNVTLTPRSNSSSNDLKDHNIVVIEPLTDSLTWRSWVADPNPVVSSPAEKQTVTLSDDQDLMPTSEELTTISIDSDEESGDSDIEVIAVKLPPKNANEESGDSDIEVIAVKLPPKRRFPSSYTRIRKRTDPPDSKLTCIQNISFAEEVKSSPTTTKMNVRVNRKRKAPSSDKKEGSHSKKIEVDRESLRSPTATDENVCPSSEIITINTDQSVTTSQAIPDQVISHSPVKIISAPAPYLELVNQVQLHRLFNRSGNPHSKLSSIPLFPPNSMKRFLNNQEYIKFIVYCGYTRHLMRKHCKENISSILDYATEKIDTGTAGSFYGIIKSNDSYYRLSKHMSVSCMTMYFSTQYALPITVVFREHSKNHVHVF